MELPDLGSSVTSKANKIWRRLGRIIARHEKVLLAILAVVILISGGFSYRQFSQNDDSQPTVGGTYVEGIVFDKDKKELNLITMRLTKAGLLGFSAEGDLTPQLVDEWSGNDEKTEYRFTLMDGISRQEIIDVLQARTDLLGEISVQADGDRDVVITLPQPNPSLPLVMTRPMFDYGPYKLGKTNDQTTVFSRNTRKLAISAYINKIIIHTYPSSDELKDALTHNRIDGAVLPDSGVVKKYQQYLVGSDKYYALLFNTNKVPFRDAGLRSALTTGGTPTAQPFVLTAPDQDPYKKLAQDLVATWQAQGAKVELNLQPQETVTGTIGPARDFQALVVGIDYGPDLDPFYIWDSTQVRATGNNVTGIKDPDIDGLVNTVRTTLDVSSRQEAIDKLHTALSTKGYAKILGEETANYYLSSKIHFVAPILPKSSADRLLAAAQWSVK